MDTKTSSLELTQKELQALLGTINHAIKSGGLMVGDIINIHPIIIKIDALLEKPKEEPIDGELIPPKQN